MALWNGLVEERCSAEKEKGGTGDKNIHFQATPHSDTPLTKSQLLTARSSIKSLKDTPTDERSTSVI